MRALSTILAALVIPFALLNLLGGIVGGIWLAILGEWSAIFFGLLIAFAGAIAVSLLLMPGIGLAAVGAVAFERGNKFAGWLFLLLASPWTYVVIIAWEFSIFAYFSHRMTTDNVIPMWLWSYAAATGVWSYMAKKESQSGDGGSAVLAAFAAQVAYIVYSICRLWLGWPLDQSVVAMVIPLFIALTLGFLTAALNVMTSRRYI